MPTSAKIMGDLDLDYTVTHRADF